MSSKLFAVGVSGPELSGREREILAANPPFGVILFRRNIENPDQLRGLIADVRGLGARFLFLDQEGGPVDRLKDLLAPAPSFRRAAILGVARRAGEIAGSSLASLGFDVDLAPVVDRAMAGAGDAVLGERAVSEDAGEIIRAAGDFLAGLHARGVGGCLKHFPGLGRARLDTHTALPLIEENRHAEALDLAPFDALMGTARAIMMSHAAGPDGQPASLNEEWASIRLRDILGFEGAAFSDDLEMGALDAFGNLPERCVRAATAGCDLLFVCKKIDAYPECVDAVTARVPAPRREEAAARLEDYAGHVAQLRKAATPGGETMATLTAELRSLDDSAA